MSWQYGEISGELEKLDAKLSETAVSNTLKAEGINPRPSGLGHWLEVTDASLPILTEWC